LKAQCGELFFFGGWSVGIGRSGEWLRPLKIFIGHSQAIVAFLWWREVPSENVSQLQIPEVIPVIPT
jgi:hypothetical protein